MCLPCWAIVDFFLVVLGPSNCNANNFWGVDREFQCLTLRMSLMGRGSEDSESVGGRNQVERTYGKGLPEYS